MNKKEKGNVILFPVNIEQYQEHLTTMLETDRFHEAAEMLQYLLSLEVGDRVVHEEWISLLDWLEQSGLAKIGDADTSPEGDHTPVDTDTEPEQTEADLLKQYVTDRTSRDPDYAKVLLDMLSQSDRPDKQWVALDQLASLNDPIVASAIHAWIEQSASPQDSPPHPLLLTKALQALKRSGGQGSVRLIRCGESVELNVPDIPLDYPNDFPDELVRVPEEADARNMHDPTFMQFAEQTWAEFVHYIYGTSIYRQLLASSALDRSVWADALRRVILHNLYGQMDAIAGHESDEPDEPHADQTAMKWLRAFMRECSEV